MKYYSLVTDDTTADLYIYGDIVGNRQLDSDVSAFSLTQELKQIEASELTVHINSYGGEVAEALSIYNTLKRLNVPVTTIVDGFACSAATIVFMAGSRRIMSEVGNFLIHPAWALTQGDAEEHRKAADNLDTITEQSITVYMEYITKSREELVALMQEERFLSPEEVLEWGFATDLEEPAEIATEDVETLEAVASVKKLVHESLTQKPKKKGKKSYMDTFTTALNGGRA